MNKYQSLFDICGTVIHGRGIGKLMGMPTANINCSNVALPPLGIYISLVLWHETEYIGVTHIGTRPTIDNEQDISVETHLLSFEGDLYGQKLKISLLEKLREPIKFSSASQLREQFWCDCSEAISFFSKKNFQVSNYNNEIVATGNLKIYKHNRLVFLDEKQLSLTPKEFDTLLLLLSKKNTIFSKKDIYEKVWHEDANGYYHQVENVISQLRKKIDWKQVASGEIVVVKGFGYKYSI